MTLPVIILGSGGHAAVLAEMLRLRAVRVIGMTDTLRDRWGTTVDGVPVLGDDAILLEHQPGSVLLVNGIGSVNTESLGHRRALFEKAKLRGYIFATVIHPSAVVSDTATLGEGVQIMAGAVIQRGARIGDNSIINTRAAVDHDCLIGRHVHIAPGSVLSGNVTVQDNVHVGTAAVVINNVTVGRGALVVAGAVVTGDVGVDKCVGGVPAKELKP